MKLRDRVTQTWWSAYETVLYDWKVPLRARVIRRALDPKLSEMSLEILSNHDFIERNHRIAEQNGRARAYDDLSRLTAARTDGLPVLPSVAAVHSYIKNSLNNVDQVITLINNQWSDQAGIDRYPADHPNNYSEYSRNYPGRGPT